MVSHVVQMPRYKCGVWQAEIVEGVHPIIQSFNPTPSTLRHHWRHTTLWLLCLTLAPPNSRALMHCAFSPPPNDCLGTGTAGAPCLPPTPAPSPPLPSYCTYQSFIQHTHDCLPALPTACISPPFRISWALAALVLPVPHACRLTPLLFQRCRIASRTCHKATPHSAHSRFRACTVNRLHIPIL
jgi:hypothetical protein